LTVTESTAIVLFTEQPLDHPVLKLLGCVGGFLFFCFVIIDRERPILLLVIIPMIINLGCGQVSAGNHLAMYRHI
jgi:hypothetical protein